MPVAYQVSISTRRLCNRGTISSSAEDVLANRSLFPNSRSHSSVEPNRHPDMAAEKRVQFVQQ
jgi:hypothetical protein